MLGMTWIPRGILARWWVGRHRVLRFGRRSEARSAEAVQVEKDLKAIIEEVALP